MLANEMVSVSKLGALPTYIELIGYETIWNSFFSKEGKALIGFKNND